MNDFLALPAKAVVEREISDPNSNTSKALSATIATAIANAGGGGGSSLTQIAPGRYSFSAVTLTPSTPAAPTFTDLAGTASDTYTIPATTGVDYQVGGVTKAAGTYPGTGTVTVTAVAKAGYVLNGTTSWSQTFGTGTPDTTAPSAVTNLAAGTPTATTVPLSWTAATDAVGVTGYEYSTNGTTYTSTGSTGTTYTVTGLAASTAYTLYVRAFDAAGNRGPAASVSATTPAAPDTTAPTAPTNLAGTAGTTTMDLSWTASTDAVGVTGYRVSKDNGATWITSAVTGTSYQVTGLTAGTSYTFAVAARDAAGNWSTNATLTKATTAAAAPSGAYGPAVLADAPSYYLPLDDAAGSTTARNLGSVTTRINDSIAVTFPATNVTFGVAGVGDGATAASFTDGSTSKIKATASGQTNSLYTALPAGSFEFLGTLDAVPVTNGSTKTLMGFGRAKIEVGLMGDGTKAVLGAYVANTRVVIGSTPIVAGTRYHLAVTFDGTNLRAYVNGVLDGTVANTYAPAAAWMDFVFAANGNAGSLTGQAGGVGFYINKALTQARIQAHSQAAGL